MESIVFGGANSGLQVGTNNAPITAEFHILAGKFTSDLRMGSSD
jgi:hypothetical protein